MVLLDALASGGRIASFSDSRKVFLDGQPMAYEVVELVAEAVSKDRVVDGLAAPFYLRDWVMLESRLPVVPLVSAPCKVTRTAQLLGTEALGHPARHLRDVTKFCSFDERAFDAQGFEFPGRFRTSRRVRRWSCHTERLSAPRASSRLRRKGAMTGRCPEGSGLREHFFLHCSFHRGTRVPRTARK
jgi:hypothetical protein